MKNKGFLIKNFLYLVFLFTLFTSVSFRVPNAQVTNSENFLEFKRDNTLDHNHYSTIETIDEEAIVNESEVELEIELELFSHISIENSFLHFKRTISDYLHNYFKYYKSRVPLYDLFCIWKHHLG